MSYVLKAFAGHESLHYLLYASTILMGRPSFIPLLPLAIYSFYNIAHVTRTTFSHYSFGQSAVGLIDKALTYQPHVMIAAQQMELFYFPQLILMLIGYVLNQYFLALV